MLANGRPSTRSQGGGRGRPSFFSLPLSRPRSAPVRAWSVDEGLRRGHAGLPVPLPGGGGFLRVLYSCNGRGLASTTKLGPGVLVAEFAIERIVKREEWPALERAGRYALHISLGRLAVVVSGASATHCASLINAPSAGEAARRPNCRIAIGRSRGGAITARVYTCRSVAAMEELLVSYGCRAHMKKIVAEARAAADARLEARRARIFGWKLCQRCGRNVRIARAALHASAHVAAAARRDG